MNDADLVMQFRERTLPFALWTHRAHVRVAYLYLQKLGFAAALDRLREDIKRYNEVNDRPDGPFEGYNETTTVAFLRLIDSTIRSYGAAIPTADSEAFCEAHSHLLNPHLLRLFYSPERRLHRDAKHTFVEPDLAPLPRVE